MVILAARGGGDGGSYEEADCNISILFSSERVQHFLFLMMLIKAYL